MNKLSDSETQKKLSMKKNNKKNAGMGVLAWLLTIVLSFIVLSIAGLVILNNYEELISGIGAKIQKKTIVQDPAIVKENAELKAELEKLKKTPLAAVTPAATPVPAEDEKLKKFLALEAEMKAKFAAEKAAAVAPQATPPAFAGDKDFVVGRSVTGAKAPAPVANRPEGHYTREVSFQERDEYGRMATRRLRLFNDTPTSDEEFIRRYLEENQVAAGVEPADPRPWKEYTINPVGRGGSRPR